MKLLFLISFCFGVIILYANAENFQFEWSGVEKIIAVGDIHGDFDNFVKILQETRLIDENYKWIGKNTHLVQIGDIMDRGPDAKKVFDLLMRLEEEADSAGGKIHMLIGNHEELNITGSSFDYPGYIVPEQLISFLPRKYKEGLEQKFRKKYILHEPTDSISKSSMDVKLNEFWKKAIADQRLDKTGELRRIYTNAFNDKYGKWILRHNAVIKINDLIFVHGGISKKYSTKKLSYINNLLRNELNEIRLLIKRSKQSERNFQIVFDPEGPLWYRGLAQENEDILRPVVDQTLTNLNANYMVTAHTMRSGSPVLSEELVSRFEGRIWIIDTGISRIYNGVLSALIIENGKFTVWWMRDDSF